ncbi:ferredoxin [Pseudonocardia spinosispora]|uniref:ferredoxin n=1 Tax=Pseudonocardia spinosispora TaxID=103441 RepID=UPI000419152A|nr:ferredoxin [Pseudonocardia spinosispora]
MSTHLRIDRGACAGHGLCYGTAPDLLDSDEQGDPVLLTEPVPDDLLDDADQVVEMCPERALTIERD